MSNLLRDRIKKRHQYDEAEHIPQSEELLKSENELLRKSQIKLNNDIKIIEQQIKDLNLDFKDPSDYKIPLTTSIKDRYLRIHEKKKDLNLAKNELVNLPKDHFNHHTSLEEQNVNLIHEFEMKKSKLKGIITNKKLEKSTLENSIKNLLKIQKIENSLTRHLTLKIILIEEQLSNLEKIEDFYEKMITSLEDSLTKLKEEKDIILDYEELYYKSEFVSGKFNEFRLKSKYIFETLFKEILLGAKLSEEDKVYLYQKKVDDRIMMISADDN